MPALYIGLMSGTSMDSVDAAVVDFSDPQPLIVASHSKSIPAQLHERLLTLCEGRSGLDEFGLLDNQLGELFAATAQELLNQADIKPNEIQAIGSHGQTVYHSPYSNPRFTLQIGDPNIIAQRTGITTVADFRRRDMAVGGQGAPLVPAFHAAVFARSELDRVVVNIGGIGNITILPAADTPVTGFDTGPGNALMDSWIMQHKHTRFDEAGAWAASGDTYPTLLDSLLSDPYFNQAPPKSTGREYFNPGWLQNHLDTSASSIAAEDIQATLAELTATTISQAIDKHAGGCRDVLVCGGGAHNTYLMDRLAALMPQREVTTTAAFGVDPNWVEAAAFAWLARQTLEHKAGNLPAVTGADQSVVLGGIYFGNS